MKEVYYTYNDWTKWGIAFNLRTVTVIHTGIAFLILSFLVVHVYMTTTGYTLFSHIAAMISGWEEVEKDDQEKKTA